MRPYSTDLRLKIVQAYARGEGSQRDLARHFGVSPSCLQALWQRYRQTGNVAPKPHGGGHPGKLKPYWGVVAQLHHRQPDATLEERCAQLAATTPVHVGRTTMHRALKQLGLTRKKRHSMRRNKTQRRDAKLARRSRTSSGSRRLKT